MKRLVLAFALGLAGCTGTGEVPEGATPMQDRQAPPPGPTSPTAMSDAPPLGTPRAKIAPDSVVPGSGDRSTIR